MVKKANREIHVGALKIHGNSIEFGDTVVQLSNVSLVSTEDVEHLSLIHICSASAMLAAGTRAGEVGIPVLLDPVGVGASRFRRETAGKLLDAVPVAVIRGNASEIKTLVLGSAGARGVDADITDQVTQENLEATAALAQTLAGKTGADVYKRQVDGRPGVRPPGEGGALRCACLLYTSRCV